MKKITKTLLFFIVGIISYLFYNSLFVVYLSPLFFCNQKELHVKKTVEKRVVQLLLYNNGRECNESAEILWFSDLINFSMQHLISRLLQMAYEEKIIPYIITVPTVVFSSSGNDAYIVFDQNPIQKEWSIKQRVEFINSIIITCTLNNVTFNNVYFFDSNGALKDEYIDFKQPWYFKTL